MAIAQDVIMLWGGTAASIPAGWARVTSLDGKFPKASAAATEPNVTGGAATHTHTSPAHSHTMISHSHVTHLSNVAQFSSNQTDSSGTEGVPGQHSHDTSVGGASGGELLSIASTYDAVSNSPPYFDLIFIKANGGAQDFKDGIIGLWNNSTVPSGFAFCDGNNTTPDLRNKYIHGAATPANAGATGGGTENIHPLLHSHSENAHTHSDYSNSITDSGGKRGQAGSNRLGRGHNHLVSLNNAIAGGVSSVNLTTVEVVEPAYKKK